MVGTLSVHGDVKFISLWAVILMFHLFEVILVS